MTTEEIIRAIRVIRHSSKRERNAGRLPSINGLAKATGLSRRSLYRHVAGHHKPSHASQEAIETALQQKAVTGRNGKRPPFTPAD